MKNLIRTSEEKLNSFDPIKSRRWDWRSYGKSYHHKVRGQWPYDIATRILKHYIGRHFDDAFSYYCTKVPVYQQRLFFDLLADSRRSYANFILTEEGIIRKRKKKRRKKAIPKITYWDPILDTDMEIVYNSFKNVKYIQAKAELAQAKKRFTNLYKKQLKTQKYNFKYEVEV